MANECVVRWREDVGTQGGARAPGSGLCSPPTAPLPTRSHPSPSGGLSADSCVPETGFCLSSSRQWARGPRFFLSLLFLKNKLTLPPGRHRLSGQISLPYV